MRAWRREEHLAHRDADCVDGVVADGEEHDAACISMRTMSFT